MHALLIIHATATIAMTGVAWFVQRVHYPLFALVGDDFVAYEAAHARRTTSIVAPLMVVEAATAVTLLFVRPGVATALGVALVLVITASTILLQVPCHRRLGQGFDRAVHQRLVATSWLRTVTWTARSGIAVWLLA